MLFCDDWNLCYQPWTVWKSKQQTGMARNQLHGEFSKVPIQRCLAWFKDDTPGSMISELQNYLTVVIAVNCVAAIWLVISLWTFSMTSSMVVILDVVTWMMASRLPRSVVLWCATLRHHNLHEWGKHDSTTQHTITLMNHTHSFHCISCASNLGASHFIFY